MPLIRRLAAECYCSLFVYGMLLLEIDFRLKSFSFNVSSVTLHLSCTEVGGNEYVFIRCLQLNKIYIGLKSRVTDPDVLVGSGF